jgi:hypothetical protein
MQAAATKSVIIKDADGQQPLAPNATAITATLDDNVPAATKVAPGGTINYTAVIKNTGTAGTDDAGSVNYSHTIDSNTTLVPGSVHASPIAFNNSYNTAIGNTLLEVSNSPTSTAPKVTAAGTLFDNDTIATAPDTIQLSSFTAASANAGTVSVNANGSFTYLPAAGFTGTDTFTYTIRNSADATLTDTATVTITVNAPRVWYVDNSGANGDGRSTSPFNTLAGAAAVDGIGDIIYIFTGGGNYTGGITLLNNEQVIGNGVALVVNTITLRAAGARPTVVNGAGNGITLASANTLSGFNFGACTGFAIQGTSVGTLTVANMLINNTSGGALDLTGVGNPIVSVVLDSTTSTGGTKNVNLAGLAGTVTLAGGALSGASGTSFDNGTAVAGSGGTATITYSGTITQTTANQKPVSIQRRTGGSVAFSGTITANTGSAGGIFLDQNGGSTISFTNSITLSTGANPAFTATGGGTVTATQNNTSIVNTLTTTTGGGLNVTSTTIGAAGLTFRSINSTVASGNPGINLNATGATGGLTVTGNSGAGTGGTISNRTGNGVTLISTSNVSLTDMILTANGTAQSVAGSSSSCGGDLATGNNLSCVANAYLQTVTGATFINLSVTNSGQQGINGNAVNGLTITNGTITGNGDEGFENGILLQNASGTVSITGTNVRDNEAREMHIGNLSGTMTLTTSSSQYGHTNSGTGNANSQQGILLQLQGTSNTTINASSLTISNNQGSGFTANGLQINADNGGPTVTGSITASTFDSNAAHVFVNVGGTSTVTFDTMNNATMIHADLQAINYTVLGGSSAITANVTGTISGNNIGTAAANGCTIASTNCHAIDVNSGEQWNGQMHLKINSNVIQKVAQGIIFTLSGGNGVTPQVHAKVQGNSITNSSAPAVGEALKLNTTVTSTNPTISVCWDVGGGGALNNTITGDWATGSSQASLFLRNRFSGNASIRLPGYGGSSTDDAAVTAYLNGRNSVTAGGSAGQVAVLVSHTGTTPFVGGAACTTPAAPIRPPGDKAANSGASSDNSSAVAAGNSQSFLPATQTAKAPDAAPEAKQAAPRVNNSSATATAVPANKIKRSDVLSHHAVRNNSRQSADSPNAPLVTVSVALGTLPAIPATGHSVTIKYAVTVNSPPVVRQVSAQGTVTFTGNPGGSVNTDDPNTGTPNDATITLIDTTETWTGAVSTDWNVAGNWNPANVPNSVSDVVIPSAGVTNEPTLTPAAVNVFSLDLQTGRTLTINSGSTLTVNTGLTSIAGALAGGPYTLNLVALTINRAAGVTINGPTSVSGVLTLTNGNITNTGNVLTIGAAGSIVRTSGHIIGSLKKTAVPATFVFTVGTVNGYTPVNLSSVSGGGDLTVTTVASQQPTLQTDHVNRQLNEYWTLTKGGTLTATLVFNYLQTDVLGTEANYEIIRVVGTLAKSFKNICPSAPCVNTATNTGTTAPVSYYGDSNVSDWTVGETVAPTASDGIVTGRIVDNQGAPVEGAVVRLDGTQSRKFITDANGIYRFENVETGGFYTVTPSRANYSFNPSVRSFSQIGESTEAAFSATLATTAFVNPLDTPEYFVRQHYLDFLGREPDEAGFNFWSNQILACGDNGECIDRKRENVSAAYFLSIEFQQTGGLVDGLYRASYGARPDFARFMPDTRSIAQGIIVGKANWQEDLETNKAAFMDAFVNRAAFHAVYDGMDDSSYVDALIANTGVSFTSTERSALLTGLGNGSLTRATALRSIAENNHFVNAKFTESFVMMEYFGYLRRDADAGGFAYWLDKLNRFGGNFQRADMVKAFIVSTEYRDRFPR